MTADLWSLYALMYRSRLVEEISARLWHQGLISGELHLGTGEEAILAGIVSQLVEGDAMALDHRGTAGLVMRGVDPVLILRELLGRRDGLCRGQGGHMHLFSKSHLAASSGIVGAAGPTAVGFALAARYLRPGNIAVAFFGEGALNQGMVMESIHLAAVWNLPVVFVCKDDGWAITTKSNPKITAQYAERARGLGTHAVNVDGRNVLEVWEVARGAIERARSGHGPTFIHAACIHLEGHFLGLPLIRIIRNPLRELPAISGPLLVSIFQRKGARLKDRLQGLETVLAGIWNTLRDPRRKPAHDPIVRARGLLSGYDHIRLKKMEQAIREEADALLKLTLQESAA